MSIIILNVVLLLHFGSVLSSEGDLSPFYQNCVKSCKIANCTDDGLRYSANSEVKQDFWCALLLWSCHQECQYHCMWQTTNAFQQRGYKIPKFHGKWPFTRICGIQEPASVFASFLNLASHYYMHTKLRHQFAGNRTLAFKLWIAFSQVCMNAWTMSIIFHSRDTPLTEFMDYACALSMVIALFVAAVIRVFYKWRSLTQLTCLFTILYYLDHARYLYSGAVDYDYNMIVNVLFGAAGFALWLVWAATRCRAGQRYVWKLVAFLLLSACTVLLELNDFPPKMGAWDAHALFHLSTSPLPLLFYSFVIDDLYFLQGTGEDEKSDVKLA